MRAAIYLAAAAASVASTTLAAQLPLMESSYADSILTQGDDDSVSILKHPSLPAHSLRIARPKANLCERDSHSRSYSGYLDVDLDKLWEHDERHGRRQDEPFGKHPKGIVEHFYFWAFESRSDPKNDPVTLWLNGGPGCSSFTGLLMELGPCNAAPFNGSKGPHTEWNEWSWNNNSTMVFLDQPIGVGYSYTSWADPQKRKHSPPPPRIYDTPSAARDASAFLHLLALHSKDVFGGDEDGTGISSFHMAGESYAGRYLPLIASQVLKDNEDAAEHPERGLHPLPLSSILIGNGITSPKHQYPAYVEYSCNNEHGYGVFLPQDQCERMVEDTPTCLALTEKCNAVSGDEPDSEKKYDVLACKMASQYCEAKLSTPWFETGRSAYDWRHWGDYEEEEWVARFLNDKHTKRALGVDKFIGDDHHGTFIGCSDAVGKHFEKSGDGARDSTWAVRDVLAKGVRVLTYFGTADFICNYLGGEKWTLDLEWSGADEFRKQPLEEWTLPSGKPTSGSGDKDNNDKGERGGDFRAFGNFTYATVDDSGHFVPHDRPRAALAMLNYWLHGSQQGRLEP